LQSLRGQQDANLKVWEKLRLVVGEGSQAGIYEARVEDFINGGVVITAPEFIGGHSLLRNGVQVVVQITREDAAYQFDSLVRMLPGDDSKRIILTPPRHLQRIQRRQFARVEYSSRVVVAHIKPDQDFCGLQFVLVHELKDFFPSPDLRRIPGELMRFDSNAQDKLVNFLFHRQIELRQKGLI